jgi:hypothetical protein
MDRDYGEVLRRIDIAVAESQRYPAFHPRKECEIRLTGEDLVLFDEFTSRFTSPYSLYEMRYERRATIDDDMKYLRGIALQDFPTPRKIRAAENVRMRMGLKVLGPFDKSYVLASNGDEYPIDPTPIDQSHIDQQSQSELGEI